MLLFRKLLILMTLLHFFVILLFLSYYHWSKPETAMVENFQNIYSRVQFVNQFEQLVQGMSKAQVKAQSPILEKPSIENNHLLVYQWVQKNELMGFSFDPFPIMRWEEVRQLGLQFQIKFNDKGLIEVSRYEFKK